MRKIKRINYTLFIKNDIRDLMSELLDKIQCELTITKDLYSGDLLSGFLTIRTANVR
jgi:hypothetical protein